MEEQIVKALLQVARSAMRAYLVKRPYDPPSMNEVTSLGLIGIFVTLRSDKEIEGSIGWLGPSQDSLGRVLADTAVAVIANDYRLEPFHADVLSSYQIEIALLHTEEDLQSDESRDPARFGVVVETSGKRGIVLPDEKAQDFDELINRALIQARIGSEEPTILRCFQITKIRDSRSS